MTLDGRRLALHSRHTKEKAAVTSTAAPSQGTEMGISRSDWRTVLAVAGSLLWLVCGTASPARAQASPVLKANFHTLSVYWTRSLNAQGVAIRYRPTGAVSWLKAQALWR